MKPIDPTRRIQYQGKFGRRHRTPDWRIKLGARIGDLNVYLDENYSVRVRFDFPVKHPSADGVDQVVTQKRTWRVEELKYLLRALEIAISLVEKILLATRIYRMKRERMPDELNRSWAPEVFEVNLPEDGDDEGKE